MPKSRQSTPLEAFYETAAAEPYRQTADAAVVLTRLKSKATWRRLCEVWDSLPASVIEELIKPSSQAERALVLGGAPLSPDLFRGLLQGEKRVNVLAAAAGSRFAPVDILEAFARSDREQILNAVLGNAHAPIEVRHQAIVTFLTMELTREPSYDVSLLFFWALAEAPEIYDSVATPTMDGETLLCIASSPDLSDVALSNATRRLELAVSTHTAKIPLLRRTRRIYSEGTAESDVEFPFAIPLMLWNAKNLRDSDRPRLANVAYSLVPEVDEGHSTRELFGSKYWDQFVAMGKYLTADDQIRRYDSLCAAIDIINSIPECRDPDTLDEYARDLIALKASGRSDGAGMISLRHRARALMNNPALRPSTVIAIDQAKFQQWDALKIVETHYPESLTIEQARELAPFLAPREPFHARDDTVPEPWNSEYFKRNRDVIIQALLELESALPGSERRRMAPLVESNFGAIPRHLIGFVSMTCVMRLAYTLSQGWTVYRTVAFLPAVFDYLVEEFGTDPARWETFDALAPTFDGTVAEIAVAVIDLT